MPFRLAILIFASLTGGCGILFGSHEVYPPERALIGLAGGPYAHNVPRFQLELPYIVEGRGGNVHDPMSLRKYKYVQCITLYLPENTGVVSGSAVKQGADPDWKYSFQGRVLFGVDTITLELEEPVVEVISDNQRRLAGWVPFSRNGTYPLKRTPSFLTFEDCKLFQKNPEAY